MFVLVLESIDLQNRSQAKGACGCELCVLSTQGLIHSKLLVTFDMLNDDLLSDIMSILVELEAPAAKTVLFNRTFRRGQRIFTGDGISEGSDIYRDTFPGRLCCMLSTRIELDTHYYSHYCSSLGSVALACTCRREARLLSSRVIALWRRAEVDLQNEQSLIRGMTCYLSHDSNFGNGVEVNLSASTTSGQCSSLALWLTVANALHGHDFVSAMWFTRDTPIPLRFALLRAMQAQICAPYTDEIYDASAEEPAPQDLNSDNYFQFGSPEGNLEAYRLFGWETRLTNADIRPPRFRICVGELLLLFNGPQSHIPNEDVSW
jgi:hypothetical protein